MAYVDVWESLQIIAIYLLEPYLYTYADSLLGISNSGAHGITLH